jgi:hypothetical protein
MTLSTLSPSTLSTTANNDEEQRRQLLAVSRHVLEQALDLVQNRLSRDDQLTVNAKHLPGSTIGKYTQSNVVFYTQYHCAGKHLRHARDHFEALLDCTSSSSKPYVLSYDTRKRDTDMEKGLTHAAEALRATLSKLEAVVLHTSINDPLILNALTPFQQTVESTFGREVLKLCVGILTFG